MARPARNAGDKPAVSGSRLSRSFSSSVWPWLGIALILAAVPAVAQSQRETAPGPTSGTSSSSTIAP